MKQHHNKTERTNKNTKFCMSYGGKDCKGKRGKQNRNKRNLFNA